MKTDNEPIRISYHRNVHYNSVVHPYKATIGVGLGLPALVPGLADRNLMQDATRVSERSHIEQTMFEDKIKVKRGDKREFVCILQLKIQFNGSTIEASE